MRSSTVAGKVSTTVQLELGELAVNVYDGRLFLKRDDGTVGASTASVHFVPPKLLDWERKLISLTCSDFLGHLWQKQHIRFVQNIRRYSYYFRRLNHTYSSRLLSEFLCPPRWVREVRRRPPRFVRAACTQIQIICDNGGKNVSTEGLPMTMRLNKMFARVSLLYRLLGSVSSAGVLRLGIGQSFKYHGR